MTSETKEKNSGDKLLHFIVDSQAQTKTRYTFLMSKTTFAAAKCEMHNIYQSPKGLQTPDKVLSTGSMEKLYRIPISNNGAAGVWILVDDHSRLLREWDGYDTTYDVLLQQFTDRFALVNLLCYVCVTIRMGHLQETWQEEIAKATVVVL